MACCSAGASVGARRAFDFVCDEDEPNLSIGGDERASRVE